MKESEYLRKISKEELLVLTNHVDKYKVFTAINKSSFPGSHLVSILVVIDGEEYSNFPVPCYPDQLRHVIFRSIQGIFNYIKEYNN